MESVTNRYCNLDGTALIKDSYGQITTGFDGVQTDIDGVPHRLYRQALINGNFDVWQRGTSFSNPNGGQYTCDRFKVVNNVDANIKVLQSTSVLNAKSKYSVRLEVMTGAGGVGAYTQLRQQVEDYYYFVGQKVTLSGYAKCDAGASFTPKIYDGIITQSGSTFNSTTWAPFSFTATLSAANTDLMTILEFNRSGLAVGVGVNFAQVQVNVGDVALPFQPRSLRDEENASLRFNRRITATDVFGIFGSGFASSTTDARIFIPFGIRMRIPPTATTSGSFCLFTNNGTSLIPVTTISSTSGNRDGIELIVTVASGLTAGTPVLLLANNDATAYLNFDAEL